MKALQLTGQKFGRLLVIKRISNNSHGDSRWKCLCDCGNYAFPTGFDLRSGHSKSCGCYQKEQASKSLTNIKKRSKNFHKSKCKAYRIWFGMMVRCYNKNFKFYNYYGGRGIRVCDKWHDYNAFVQDMGHPDESMTIDRIDPNGDYCPENCRWATMEVQNKNRRSNIYIIFHNKQICAKEFASLVNIPYYIVRKYYHMGLTDGELIINKVNQIKNN